MKVLIGESMKTSRALYDWSVEAQQHPIYYLFSSGESLFCQAYYICFWC